MLPNSNWKKSVMQYFNCLLDINVYIFVNLLKINSIY